MFISFNEETLPKYCSKLYFLNIFFKYLFLFKKKKGIQNRAYGSVVQHLPSLLSTLSSSLTKKEVTDIVHSKTDSQYMTDTISIKMADSRTTRRASLCPFKAVTSLSPHHAWLPCCQPLYLCLHLQKQKFLKWDPSSRSLSTAAKKAVNGHTAFKAKVFFLLWWGMGWMHIASECVGPCVQIQKPKQDIGCLPLLFSVLVLRQSLLWNQTLAILERLADQYIVQICLSLPSDVVVSGPHNFLYRCLGFELRFPHLQSKCFFKNSVA